MTTVDPQLLKQHGYIVLDITVSHRVRLSPSPAQFSCIALCVAGTCELEMNLERFSVGAGMCVCYSQLSQFRVVQMSDDLQLRVLVLSDKFSFDLSMGIDMAQLQLLVERPVLVVDDAHLWDMLQSLFNSLSAYAQVETIAGSTQVSGTIVRSMVIALSHLAMARAARTTHRAPFTMADNYYRQFIRLASKHMKLEHEVIFYAKQLNITPKYLSQICQQKSGHKAKEILSMLLLRHIKHDLVFSGKSLKNLAAEYGFADQSSLGKFFRKMTGLSPLHYKQYEATRGKMGDARCEMQDG